MLQNGSSRAAGIPRSNDRRIRVVCVSMKRATRIGLGYLGVILLAQGIGKAVDTTGYIEALAAFGALPDAGLGLFGRTWMFAELLSGAGLLATAVGRGQVGRPAAMGAMAVTTAYLVLTGGAWLRGLDVANCTCFGVYLPQKLSLFVLFQDVLMLMWAAWALRTVTPRTYGEAPQPLAERPTPM